MVDENNLQAARVNIISAWCFFKSPGFGHDQSGGLMEDLILKQKPSLSSQPSKTTVERNIPYVPTNRVDQG